MRQRHVLLLGLCLILAYALAWQLFPVTYVPYLVVDKTVPDTTFREHRAIFWLAEHFRVAGSVEGFLDWTRDYLGYHPASDRRDQLDTTDLDGIMLLYLADVYGVYDYEDGLQEYERRLPHEHQEITLQYGGFSPEEVGVIVGFAGCSSRIIVGEHNIFGYPTYLAPDAARQLQELFGVDYRGWLVRYYADIDEAAFWMKQLYERIHGRAWDLRGPGIVLVREAAAGLDWLEDLLIFQGDDLTGPWPNIRTVDHALTAGAGTGIPYLYWVEVLAAEASSQVLAYYTLPLSEAAARRLQDRGIGLELPAMVRSGSEGESTRVYFAGDFADQLPPLLPTRLAGAASIQRVLSMLPGMPLEYRFFFQWYAPVMRNIMGEASGQ